MSRSVIGVSSTILLDTTVLIDVLRNRNGRRSIVGGMIASGQALATSVICIAEVYSGLRPGEEAGTQLFLETLEWFPVSAEIAKRAGELKASFRRLGKTHSITDMIVAATALEPGFSVATDNLKDFLIPELVFYPLP